MFFRHLFKVFVFTLSILAIHLLSAYLDKYLSDYRGQYNALTFTLLGMGAVVLIFYPLLVWMDRGVDRLARGFLGFGKNLAGRKLGMILAFTAGFYGLFFLYGKLWFNANLHPQVLAALKTAVFNIRNLWA